MEESHYVSTMAVARALGVGVTTVKRWVDEGILPAYRTPGGHRKLLLADVLRLSRDEKFPQADLSQLSCRSAVTDLSGMCRSLTAALMRGDGTEVRRIIRGAYFAGVAPAILADECIAPAMARVGHEWEQGQIDVLHEHRSTMLCAGAIRELQGQLTDRPAEPRPVALGGGPARDPYLLIHLLIEVVLIDLGWDVINLGPNTPLASFTRALHEFRPRLWWLSISYLDDPIDFVAGYHQAYSQAEQLKVAVAIGGRGLTPEMRVGLPCTTHGEGLAHLASFARTLAPPPARPPRGRPRKESA